MSVQVQSDERRVHQRKFKPFYVAFSGDGVTFVPAYGLDISRGGVGVFTPNRTPDGEFRLRIMLEGRDFIATVVRQRETEQQRDGKTWYGCGLRFTSIKDENLAFIEDYVAGRVRTAASDATLGELEGTFGEPEPRDEAAENNRAAPRKRKPFYIAFSINDVLYIPAYGLDVGRDGMRLFTQVQMPEDPFKVRALIEGRDFKVTAKKCWEKQVPQGDKTGWMTGTRFTEIEPLDREFIECYVAGKPFYGGNKLLEALEKLRQEPERADRWLPPELLNELLERLVGLKRLAPLNNRNHPLVRYKYEGAKTIGDEKVHLLFIESRIAADEGPKRFISRFGFNESGANIRVFL